MGYARALGKAWADLSKLPGERNFSVKLLSDTYTVDLDNKTIISSACNIPAKEHTSIIVLHYLIKKLESVTLPQPSGEWIDFNQIEGGEGYYPAFKKRTISHVLKKYGANPDAILKVLERLPAEVSKIGDAGVVVYPFENVPVLITLSRADDEFGPEANILFDKTIQQVFCTEDIVVLTEFVVHSL